MEYSARRIPGEDDITTRNLLSLSPFLEEGVWYTRGHFGIGLARVLGQDKLTILSPTSELAWLEMIHAHQITHMGGPDTCA